MLAAVSGSINRGQQKPSVELWGHVNLQDQYCAYPMYRVTLKDLDIVHRFSSRTALCLGDSRTRWIYKAESSKLVCHYAFLFHAALALTMFHDRILEFSPPAPPSRKELLHRLHGARLLKEKLSGDLVLTPAERDALWIAAVILGVSTIATIEANTPDEAWPLQRPSPSDLDWLGMADGKREIWRICDVSGPDSALQSLLHLADDGPRFGPVELGSMLENLPAAVLRLLHLEPGLTQNHAASPYYQMAEAVNRLMPVPCTQDTLMLFLSFLNEMPRSSRRLLRLKDPGAILLLAYWFAMVSHCQHWWTWRRSVLECQSICIYLERNHSDIPDLQDAIAFPKQACGPASGRDKDGSAAGSSATQTTVAHPAVVPAA